MGVPRSAYQRTPLWEEKRAQVITRSGGVCEECRNWPGQHVHHRWYAEEGIGHEPIEWLVHLCLGCHQAKHPHHRMRSVREQQLRAKQRRQGKKRRSHCAHCGNTYSPQRHESICVRFGLTERVKPQPPPANKKRSRRSAKQWRKARSMTPNSWDCNSPVAKGYPA